MLALAALTTTADARGVSPPPPSTAASEPASVGSPSAVPVPWASIAPSAAAGTPATDSTARSSVCCAEPFGAVRLALRPSCRTATPLNAATPPPGAAEPDCNAALPTPSLRT